MAFSDRVAVSVVVPFAVPVVPHEPSPSLVVLADAEDADPQAALQDEDADDEEADEAEDDGQRTALHVQY
ncbi:hypothetical protein [Haloarcula sp. JP-L23]|uniref:hypothetical protein n=1 Tax=Haloarcula sp. JP-L23 TaxID=2716717 RepID=UPI00140F15F8|nr:hypothetical protein G9465_04910 [Haloarcula sp. JP-L23]